MTRRVVTGFGVAVAATLTFHQAMWALLFGLGLMGPLPLAANRFGVPLLVGICFWRGLWGAAYGAVGLQRFRPAWRSGLAFGLGVGACEWAWALLRSSDWALSRERWAYLAQALLVNGCWGFGLGLMLAALSAQAGRPRKDRS